MIADDNDQLPLIKKSFEKMGIQYDTDEEYLEAHRNLVGFFDVLIQMDLEQKARMTHADESDNKID